MKEATGELNMTVITVVIIAALAAVAAAFVIPAISTGIRRNSCASALGIAVENVTEAVGNECCGNVNGTERCIELSE